MIDITPIIGRDGRLSFKRMNQFPEIVNAVCDLYPQLDKLTALYVHHHKMEPRRCKMCERFLFVRSFTFGYDSVYCSKECLHSDKEFLTERALKGDRKKGWETARENNLRKYGCVIATGLPETQEKRKKTCLEKYGVESPTQSDIVKEKTRKTNLEKYGVVSPTQSEKVKEKTRKTNLERYGVDYHTQTEEYREFMREYSPILQEKSKKTCLEKYGVEYASQAEEVKQKVAESFNEKYGGRGFAIDEHKKRVAATIFARYGVLYPSQSEEIMKRREETMMERYGVPSIFMTEDFKEQRRKTLLEKYGAENLMDSEEIRAKIAATMTERYGNPIYFKTEDYKEKSSFERGFKSAPHQFIESVLDSLGVEYVSNDRKTIYPLEIDILIPSLKIGFEINGVYWHSSDSKEADKELSKYHLNKTELMNAAGIG